MKMFSLALLAVCTLIISANAFSEDLTETKYGMALSDEEMRMVNGRIIADGIFSEEEERALIVKFQQNDEEAAKAISQINRMVTDARMGKMTEDNLHQYYFQYLQRLSTLGVPDSVIDHQMELLIQAQDRAAKEAADEVSRRALFQQFINSIQNFEQTYRSTPQGANMVIDLGNIFGAFYNIPEISAQLPGGSLQIEIVR